MTRVAAIYDVHGNLPALEAVLRDVEDAGVDLILSGGDVAWGPWPRETVELLAGLANTVFVRGNADREVALGYGTQHGLDETTAAVNGWCAEQLSQEQRDWLVGSAEGVSLDVDGLGSVLFCHGSPRSDEEPITPFSPKDRLQESFGEVRESTVVCGHTHMQFVRAFGTKKVLNAGSVGLPYQGRPGAFWALLGPDVEMRQTEYDVASAVAAMRGTGCPHVIEVFVDALLNPLDLDEAARQFEAAAVGKTY